MLRRAQYLKKYGSTFLVGSLALGMLLSSPASMVSYATQNNSQQALEGQEDNPEDAAWDAQQMEELKERSFQEIVYGTGYEETDEAHLVEIKIATQEDLEALAENCRLDSWSADKKIVLEKDIYLREDTTLTIPVFRGVFDGNGHIIAGVNLSENGAEMGLFRYLQAGGVIRNLTVRGTIKIGGQGKNVSGLVAVNCGYIVNCSFEGKVTGVENVGGIAGYNTETGIISACNSIGFYNGEHSVGGIVGKNDGVVNACQNSGSINTEGTEVNYDLDNLTVENLTDVNSTSKIAAFTDVGGIAGVSEGKIFYCTNAGHVGYPRVGYNVGGIAGRVSQGYLAGCTNTGLIQGRKDVGGIAGQLEPFMIGEYLTDGVQMVQQQTQQLQAMIDKTTGDINRYGNQLTGMMSSLGDNLQDFNELNPDISTPLKDQLPTNKATDQKLKLTDQKQIGGQNGKELEENVEILKSNLQVTQDYAKQFNQVLTNGSNTIDADTRAIRRQVNSLQQLIEDMQKDLLSYEGISFSDASDENASEISLDELLATLGDSLSEEELEDAVKNAVIGSSGDTSENIEDPQTAEENADMVISHTGAEQLRSGAQRGKVQLCVNQGTVEADTTVGGIVGRVSVEYDADPEEDVELTGDQSLKMEASTRAIVRDCRNLGNVEGKKNQIGGILGLADFGSVISCESYGDVSCIDGNYVGGIAGIHRNLIRSSYSMCVVEGLNYVGGIVGYGDQIFDSVAYNELSGDGGERVGAVAGQINSEGQLYGNYYVTGQVYGVNGIDYQYGAEPISYADLSNMAGIPSAFSDFTILFLAEGNKVAEIQTHYGESISEDRIPAVPTKEGYYGVWPTYNFDFVSGNKVLEARYEKWTGNVSSEQMSEAGKPLLLAVGDFLPGAEMELSVSDENYKFSIYYPETAETAGSLGITDYTGAVQVRLLTEDTDHISVQVLQDGVYHEVETTVMGSYLAFEMEQPGSFRVVEVVDYAMYIKIGILVLVLIIILVVLLTVRRVRKIKKKINDRIEEEVTQRLSAIQEEKKNE